jgi:hypothetical protein
MVDRRRSLHRELIGSMRAQVPSLLATEVSYRSEIERMSLERAPLAVHAPRSEAALIYAALWAEIAPRLGARHCASPGSPQPPSQGSQDTTLRSPDYVLRSDIPSDY